jgi:DNA-binding NarL/FixJ family response regulator
VKLVVGAQHALLREGLRELLRRWSGIEVVGLVPDASDAARLARRLRADVMLLVRSDDPRADAQAIASVRSGRSGCKVVLLDSSGRRGVRDDLDADCRLGSGIGITGLVRALCAACGRGAEGESDGRLDGAGEEPVLLLSRREADVARAVCAGLSNKGVAKRLGISEKTVKNHLASIYQRVGLEGRTQLAVWALSRGLAAGPGPSDGSDGLP